MHVEKGIDKEKLDKRADKIILHDSSTLIHQLNEPNEMENNRLTGSLKSQMLV
jgi:hypothetical protein